MKTVKTGTVRCPKCNKLAFDFSFCLYCGGALAHPQSRRDRRGWQLTCPACGAPVDARGANFCVKCSHKLPPNGKCKTCKVHIWHEWPRCPFCGTGNPDCTQAPATNAEPVADPAQSSRTIAARLQEAGIPLNVSDNVVKGNLSVEATAHATGSFQNPSEKRSADIPRHATERVAVDGNVVKGNMHVGDIHYHATGSESVLVEKVFEQLDCLGEKTLQVSIGGSEKIAKLLDKSLLENKDACELTKELVQRFKQCRQSNGLNRCEGPYCFHGSPYVLFDLLLSGKTLTEWCSSTQGVGPTAHDLLNVVMELCDILAGLRRERLFHGNLKPDNIFVMSNQRVKLTDFCLFRDSADASGRNLPRPYRYDPVFLPSDSEDSGEHADERTEAYAVCATLCASLVESRHPDEWTLSRLVDCKWAPPAKVCNAIVRGIRNPGYRNIEEFRHQYQTAHWQAVAAQESVPDQGLDFLDLLPSDDGPAFSM